MNASELIDQQLGDSQDEARLRPGETADQKVEEAREALIEAKDLLGKASRKLVSAGLEKGFRRKFGQADDALSYIIDGLS